MDVTANIWHFARLFVTGSMAITVTHLMEKPFPLLCLLLGLASLGVVFHVEAGEQASEVAVPIHQ